ncbi:DUF3048 domain-containing protein [Savagea sp. SN6]|uniref:DUF3048 domain-containing protein n=1 Tax=Savagea serpentis TaxID=2785297 RepID=A0A8J7G678_9BACL|nr:DUF3048 domain-containing protein [Savagea serpentis]MBF4502157.1 DUF3048 domain-containing protein [Savagea serpentis]
MKKLWIAMACSLALVACSKDKEVKEESTMQEEPEEVVEEVVLYDALTGIEIEEENQLKPIVATINNDPKARPQTGVGAADVMYEFLIEGQGTRYLAVYHSEMPEQIGPMRSARHYFLPIPQDLQAFYVAHGYSPLARQQLSQGAIKHVNGMEHDGSLFKRSSDRYAPHNSYITYEAIQQAMDMTSTPLDEKTLPELTFNEEPVTRGTVETMSVRYGSSNLFKSDYRLQEDGTYIRSVNGETFIERLTGEAVPYANVIVIEGTYDWIDQEGRRNFDLQQGGRGLLFQNGNVLRIEWTYDGGMIRSFVDGVEIPYEKGKTFIHAIPADLSLENSVSYEEKVE